MPLLATGFIYSFGGAKIFREYDRLMKEIVDPENKIVDQMHAISGVTKAKSSWFCNDAITECR